MGLRGVSEAAAVGMEEKGRAGSRHVAVPAVPRVGQREAAAGVHSPPSTKLTFLLSLLPWPQAQTQIWGGGGRKEGRKTDLAEDSPQTPAVAATASLCPTWGTAGALPFSSLPASAALIVTPDLLQPVMMARSMVAVAAVGA